MSKLDELRKLCEEAFNNAETKQQIEAGALIMNKFSEVEAERTAMEQENKELLNNYKDVVLHGVSKETREAPKADVAETLDFSDFLQQANNN